ncbi:Hypothetical_protein [Hexamita inflata]|uniref:Hypothetical_protein n=1 Tax=Hexamita inflata TaxID=28002 RepID=A0AA86Q7M0_9EUKA|nr:Hypothetical protein HINF_LOCUS26115 [Hexamita inflata]CAI9947627.1 Hypothetical protein HINF_LOCUS35272 [Hexamita inflata]CAI9976463.1 Hypothetical protein HINF_LOCUS64108 [Hexamita inflata]
MIFVQILSQTCTNSATNVTLQCGSSSCSNDMCVISLSSRYCNNNCMVGCKFTNAIDINSNDGLNTRTISYADVYYCPSYVSVIKGVIITIGVLTGVALVGTLIFYFVHYRKIKIERENDLFDKVTKELIE